LTLGTGETDFDTMFDLLAEHEYRGNFIIQAARGDDDVAVAGKHLAFSRELVQRHLH
jgi:sugar phosphate isomerase/epimerase